MRLKSWKNQLVRLNCKSETLARLVDAMRRKA